MSDRKIMLALMVLIELTLLVVVTLGIVSFWTVPDRSTFERVGFTVLISLIYLICASIVALLCIDRRVT